MGIAHFGREGGGGAAALGDGDRRSFSGCEMGSVPMATRGK